MELDKFYKLFITQGFKYSTDSRDIPRGSIFFALKGENFNGNNYAIQAIKDGASYAVVDEEVGHDIKLIKVDNVLRFMQDVANMQRRAFDIPVLAVAGSNGKTTTKNLIEAVLNTQFKTHVTQGNFNNHIGVPKTLLDMPQDTELAIVELGTNNPGEIKALCQMVEPTHGVITNIGKEHLEGFGTLEAVAKEESEVYHYLLKHDGHAFVNGDDEWLVRMSRSITNKTTYSSADVTIKHLVPSISVKYKGLSIDSGLMGDYNLDNILTAIAIGEHFNISPENIVEGINAYLPDNNRSQLIVKGTNTIWLDAYNANPSSMEKAIGNFIKLPEAQKVLILGDMFEMGQHATHEHAALLTFIAALGLTDVYLLGQEFERAARGTDFTTYSSMDDLQQALRIKHYQDTAFLVKGSRGMRMELSLDAILDK